MKTLIKLLSIALMLSSIIIANFTILGSRADETGKQWSDAQLLSGEGFDKAVKMALLDENVTRLSKFLWALNYKSQASDDVAVRVTWSDKSGQHNGTGVGLAFKNNEDNATIVYVKTEEESRTFAFTFHKSVNGTIVTVYGVDQNGTVIMIDWGSCLTCLACVGLLAAVLTVCCVGCIGSGLGYIPCVIACLKVAIEPLLPHFPECVDKCEKCFESVGGILVPVDKFSLLAPYAVCYVFITAATVSIAVYRKKHEDQDAEPESRTRKCSSADSRTH